MRVVEEVPGRRPAQHVPKPSVGRSAGEQGRASRAGGGSPGGCLLWLPKALPWPEPLLSPRRAFLRGAFVGTGTGSLPTGQCHLQGGQAPPWGSQLPAGRPRTLTPTPQVPGSTALLRPSPGQRRSGAWFTAQGSGSHHPCRSLVSPSSPRALRPRMGLFPPQHSAGPSGATPSPGRSRGTAADPLKVRTSGRSASPAGSS